MRWSWLAPAGVALACLPCLLVLLVAAGIGTGALSASGAVLSQTGLAVASAIIAGLFLAASVVLLVRRRSATECGCLAEASAVPTSRSPADASLPSGAGPPR